MAVLLFFLSPWAAKSLIMQSKAETTEARNNNSFKEMDRLYNAANRNAKLAFYICEYRLLFCDDESVRKLRIEAMFLKYSSQKIICIEPTN